jgi:hypothetical protein
VGYPVGHWVGCYAGPELIEMIQRNEIESVDTLAEYHREPAFRSFASSILGERLKRRRDGDLVGESMAKLIGNAFAGKFAARGGGWRIDEQKTPARYWGPWQEINAETGTVQRFRAFAGIVQRWEERSPDPTGCPSIFAYLTSYGRVYMSWIRSALPDKSVYHMDTDGLWCHPDCETILKEHGYKFGDDPGMLRVDGECSYLRFLTSKHYCVDGEWVLSGITPDGQPHLDMKWIDSVCHRPSQVIHDGPVSDVVHIDREIDLSMLHHDGVMTRSGWLKPHRIPKTRNLIDPRDDDEYVYGLPPDEPSLF